MDISDPSVNRPMPTMSSTPPSRNAIMALLGTGAMVKPSASTISMMGSTDVSDSCRGFLKMDKKPCAFFRCFRRRACSSCTVLLVKLPFLSLKKWRICPISGRYALVSLQYQYIMFAAGAQGISCKHSVKMPKFPPAFRHKCSKLLPRPRAELRRQHREPDASGGQLGEPFL